MKEHAILIKKFQRQILHGRCENNSFEIVVGITSQNSKTIMLDGYRLDGKETEELLEVDSPKAGRITTFFERCVKPSKVNRPYYDCHQFTGYVATQEDTSPEGDRNKELRYERFETVQPNALESGMAYAVIGEDNEPTHSMLGVNDPEKSLSVFGERQPLIIIKNRELLGIYGGTHVVQVWPELQA